MPVTGIRLWRKLLKSKRPGSSFPTIPTGKTLTPSSARLFTAFAPPPGTTVRSRWRRMSTGASRDTREISPKTNSSATMSPSTVTVMRGKLCTILLSRSVSLGTLLMFRRILSRGGLAFTGRTKNGIQSSSGIDQFHAGAGDEYGAQCGGVGYEINLIFFRRDKAGCAGTLAQGQQFPNISLTIGMVITVELRRDRLDASHSQLFNKVLRTRDAAKNHWTLWRIGDLN